MVHSYLAPLACGYFQEHCNSRHQVIPGKEKLPWVSAFLVTNEKGSAVSLTHGKIMCTKNHNLSYSRLYNWLVNHLPLEEFGLVQPQQQPPEQPMTTINVEVHGNSKPTDFPALAYHHVQDDDYEEGDYNEQYLQI